jgi:GTPase SAR1 family protein
MSPIHPQVPSTPRRPDDPRVAAFCSSNLLPDLFQAFAQSTDVWRADPFDVESIHAPARTWFDRVVSRTKDTAGISTGRILLLLGDSGSGKTHLMRAFRNRVHSGHRGYCGYMQMTAFTGEYPRYVLNNLIESLDKPYYEPESSRTGLIRLSGALAESPGEPCRDALEQLRERDLDQASIDRIVFDMADRIVLDDRFRDVDIYLVQALLYLQRDDPRIKARVLKYLRCEDLTSRDREWLGGIVPNTYADAPSWVVQRLGRVIWEVERVPLILCVDQLEEVFDLDQVAVKFRRAMATLCDLVSRLPSAIVVISCLNDFYVELRKMLTMPVKDRVENDPRPVDLQGRCSRDEVVGLVGRRLRRLFEASGASYDEDKPTAPLPDGMTDGLAGLRARDVLLQCQAYRERCIEEGKMAAYPSGEAGGKIADDSGHQRIIELEQAWNDFKSSHEMAVPTDEESLAAILARAIHECSDEQAAGHAFEAEPDGRFVPVERHGPDDGVEKIIVGVCNKAARGGALARQVEELSRRAAEDTAVVVRSTSFPVSPKAAITQLLNTFVEAGRRKVVVEDSDWRTMAALAAFRKVHAESPHYLAWCRQSRPLSSLQSLREILGLDRPPQAPHRPTDSPPVADRPLSEGGEPTGTETTTNGTHPRSGPASPTGPLLVDITTDRRAEPVTLDPAELTRHAAFLGASGSGKTTLALGLVEQLLVQGIPAILVDRKGDLCSYTRPDMGLREGLGGPLAERASRLMEGVEVALYTPRRSDGRPLTIAAAPAGLGQLSEQERQQAARIAAAALAGMMNYGDGQRHKSCLAILTKAIEVLGQQSSEAAISVQDLIQFVAEKDSSLVDEIGHLDAKHVDRLVQDLAALRINQGDLLEARGETLDIEAMLGLGRHARPGKTRLSVVSTRFLGNNADVQFWVAQFLMEVGRWIGRAPAPEGQLQAVLMFDEADLYLPAVRQPASKEPMENLLRRARSAGLGLLLASQSPGDFDYRCRDNIRTWLVGQVKEANSLAKMKPMLGECRIDVAARFPGQSTGEFHLLRDGAATGLKAEPSAVDPRQVPEEEILELARRSLQRG